MTYFYVLTLQLPGFDPVTYKGACDLAPGATASGLLEFVTTEFLKAMGRPGQTQYAILYWHAGPDVLVPASDIEEARR